MFRLRGRLAALLLTLAVVMSLATFPSASADPGEAPTPTTVPEETPPSSSSSSSGDSTPSMGTSTAEPSSIPETTTPTSSAPETVVPTSAAPESPEESTDASERLESDSPEPEWEPEDLGEQRSRYSPPSAEPVTDIEQRPSRQRAISTVYACQAYGDVPRWNPRDQVMRDVFAYDGFAPRTVGDGHGNINWNQDPYASSTWRLWFASLRWLGDAIEAGRAGDSAALTRAETVVRDWLRDHPRNWVQDHDNIEANTHRLNTLLCLREVVMVTNGGSLPSNYAWLDDAIILHAQHNVWRWSGANNHGSMENRALLGTGCIYGRTDFQQTAVDRIGQAFTTQVDAEGLSNEMSSTYALFNYNLFSDIRDLMARCGWSSSLINSRMALMAEATAHMVDGSGYYHQYGDTAYYKAQTYGSPEMVWAGTNGTAGRPPNSRVKLYNRGLVFGRSSWGNAQEGFHNEPSWMLRGGTGREYKAHPGDVMQFLYTAQGRRITIDGGHAGVEGSWNRWADSPLAHSTLHVPSGNTNTGVKATVTRSSLPAGGKADFVELTHPYAPGASRIRGTLVMHDPDIAVVLDRTRHSAGGSHVSQTLWNLPADQSATWVNRSTVTAQVPGSNQKTTFIHLPLTGGAVGRGETTLFRGQMVPDVRGFWFASPTDRRVSDQIAFTRSGAAVDRVSVIVPSMANETVTATRGTYSDGATKVTIRIGSRSFDVRITAGGFMSAPQPVTPATLRFGTRSQVGHGWPADGMVLDGGDVNRDGYSDVFLKRADGTLWFYAGRAGDRWQAPIQVGRGWNTMTWIDTGADLNGDGIPDMLGRDTAGRMFRYTGNANGTFVRPVQVGHGWNTRTNIAMLPAGGGRLATITAVDPQGYLHTYDMSNGVVVKQARLGRGWGGFLSNSGVADITGDGIADMFAVTGTGELRLYRGTTNGGFQTHLTVGQGWRSMRLPIIGTGKPGVSNHFWAVDSTGKLWKYPFTWS